MEISKIFDEEQLAALKRIGIEFDDSKEYTDNELSDIIDRVEEAYLDEGFDRNGEPKQPACSLWESIMDTLYDNGF